MSNVEKIFWRLGSKVNGIWQYLFIDMGTDVRITSICILELMESRLIIFVSGVSWQAYF